MTKYLNAILWKEFKSIRLNITGKIISQVGISIIITIIFAFKIKMSNTGININKAQNFLIYILMVIGYISFISNLRFWQEKSLKTIESLLATPVPMKLIIFSKVLAPTIISILTILVHYCIYGIFFNVFLKINTFSANTLLLPILFSTLFCICYGIINGYGMWCASITVSKILQFFSISIYLTSLFAIFAIPSDTNILNGNIKYAFAILIILSCYCLLFTSKEKAITTLHE